MQGPNLRILGCACTSVYIGTRNVFTAKWGVCRRVSTWSLRSTDGAGLDHVAHSERDTRRSRGITITPILRCLAEVIYTTGAIIALSCHVLGQRIPRSTLQSRGQLLARSALFLFSSMTCQSGHQGVLRGQMSTLTYLGIGILLSIVQMHTRYLLMRHEVWICANKVYELRKIPHSQTSTDS